jgi:hypothetical protein
MTITLQDLQVLNEKALEGDGEAYADFAESLVNYYRSGALQRLAELAEEVSHIAKAERFNREKFGDDTAYADWVQSRCRFVLSARAPSVKEKGPCPLCGRTDPHSHTVGPGGMS